VDGLVVIGGDGSQAGALALSQRGFPVVGVASTIDNDLAGCDTTIGVDTALNTAVQAIDRLRDTASSHHRALVIEVMGRHSGYLALMAAVASGAELAVIPEIPIAAGDVAAALRDAYARGKSHFIVVLAEGAEPSAHALCEMIEAADPGFEARPAVLGHVQRGGCPTVFDRLLATRLGAAAVEALAAEDAGFLVGIAHARVIRIPLSEASGGCNKVDPALYHLAGVLAR
jgi:6-phosphofructokinase 1